MANATGERESGTERRPMMTYDEYLRRDYECTQYRLRCMRAALLKACEGDREKMRTLYQAEKERLEDPMDRLVANSVEGK